MKQKLRILTAVTIALKLLLLFTVNRHVQLNNDEERNFQVAWNKIQGNNYSVFDPQSNSYKLTAFHGTWSVLIYEQLIRAGITKNAWYYFIHIAGIFLFAVSIPLFFKLSFRLSGHELYSFFATVTYCVYPSMLVYIGTGFFYENLVLPMLLIVVFRLTNAIRTNFKIPDYVIIALFVTISWMLRTHTIVIYLLLFAVFGVISLQRKKMGNLLPACMVLLAASLVQIPVLVKNYRLFGAPVLSTQAGYELLQGHNPLARGSWRFDWYVPGTPMYVYAHRELPGLNHKNEYEAGKARGRLAIEWIKKNPWQELKLAVRKIAIYFIPSNYGMVPGAAIWNPVNMLVHIGFGIWMLMAVIKCRPGADEWLTLLPVVASLLLTLVFFVGYRWRMYAEPFMILLAWKMLADLYYRRLGKISQ